MPAVLAAVWRVIGPILTAAIPVPLFLIVAVLIWAHFDKASAVRHAVDNALERLVYSAENESLKARLAQEKKNRGAAEVALANLSRTLTEIDKRTAAQEQLREQERTDYETKLAQAGRGCHLDDDDIRWLRRPKGR